MSRWTEDPPTPAIHKVPIWNEVIPILEPKFDSQSIPADAKEVRPHKTLTLIIVGNIGENRKIRSKIVSGFSSIKYTPIFSIHFTSYVIFHKHKRGENLIRKSYILSCTLGQEYYFCSFIIAKMLKMCKLKIWNKYLNIWSFVSNNFNYLVIWNFDSKIKNFNVKIIIFHRF